MTSLAKEGNPLAPVLRVSARQLGQGGELYSVAAFAALCLFVAIGLARSPDTLIEAVYRSLKR